LRGRVIGDEHVEKDESGDDSETTEAVTTTTGISHNDNCRNEKT
jgi:hypothetical protein